MHPIIQHDESKPVEFFFEFRYDGVNVDESKINSLSRQPPEYTEDDITYIFDYSENILERPIRRILGSTPKEHYINTIKNIREAAKQFNPTSIDTTYEDIVESATRVFENTGQSKGYCIEIRKAIIEKEDIFVIHEIVDRICDCTFQNGELAEYTERDEYNTGKRYEIIRIYGKKENIREMLNILERLGIDRKECNRYDIKNEFEPHTGSKTKRHYYHSLDQNKSRIYALLEGVYYFEKNTGPQ